MSVPKVSRAALRSIAPKPGAAPLRRATITCSASHSSGGNATQYALYRKVSGVATLVDDVHAGSRECDRHHRRRHGL